MFIQGDEMDQWKEMELEEYLSTFLERHPCEAVSEIVYCSTETQFQKAMTCNYPGKWDNNALTEAWQKMHNGMTFPAAAVWSPTLGLNRKNPILIFRGAESLKEEEFLSVLNDHEYVHARDWARGIPINGSQRITEDNRSQIKRNAIQALMEMRAYANQLEKMPDDWEGRALCRSAFKGYYRHSSFLEETLKISTNETERILIRDFLAYERERARRKDPILI